MENCICPHSTCKRYWAFQKCSCKYKAQVWTVSQLVVNPYTVNECFVHEKLSLISHFTLILTGSDIKAAKGLHQVYNLQQLHWVITTCLNHSKSTYIINSNITVEYLPDNRSSIAAITLSCFWVLSYLALSLTVCIPCGRHDPMWVCCCCGGRDWKRGDPNFWNPQCWHGS